MSQDGPEAREDWLGLGDGRLPETKGRGLSLTGVPGCAQAYWSAVLSRRQGGKILLVAETPRQQEEIANELEAWGSPSLFYPELAEQEGALEDADLSAERLRVLRLLSEGASGPLVLTRRALGQAVPAREALQAARLELKAGMAFSPDILVERLAAAGYVHEALTVERGQFSRRGGILDVFSRGADLPLRLEWFGDELDSLREFDPAEQVSVRSLERAEILMAAGESGGGGRLEDYLDRDWLRVYLAGEHGMPELAGVECYEHGFLRGGMGDVILAENRRRLLLEHLEDWLAEGWNVWISCNNEGEEQRLRELLREAPGNLEDRVRFWLSPLLRGFAWPERKLALLSDAEIFGRYQTLRARRKQDRLAALRGRRESMDFGEIEDGGYVVHAQHGVALFRGMQRLPGSDEGAEESVLVLEFQGGVKLFVPLEQAYLVAKYVGVGKHMPELDALGGTRWEKAKAQAEKAVRDYAASLLRLEAERETLQGFAFPPDGEWQDEFESAFLYDETADQLKAIRSVKEDMESVRPMDRLVCGDVGFGKTEVAIRAIFKAVAAGKQAAFLAPTTVLAQQHWQNLRERFADYPMSVELLSRFRTKKEQDKTIRLLGEGGVDVVVGTHRLISKDVKFKELGLVVIDEEQRFGVRQKERFKELFRLVDVITLSATPIPRTLYLALMGARDMSMIETPPKNRLPVETTITAYDERLIRMAIERELARGGQVYFLHNRVMSIGRVADRVRFLVPGARVDVGHGQMGEDELEEVMARFVGGQTDVLVSTTIIESGLDIPNANTIIIDRADLLGLADLYQLRGRVGRSDTRAYALLLVPRDLLAGDAGKRVRAIKQYSQLGAGFKIAMRDLEIRGAGNLLGTAQSGHIMAVGFDTYCRLLRKAVAVMKGEEAPELREIVIRLDFLKVGEGRGALNSEEDGEPPAEAYIPSSYMSEVAWRVNAYRALAELQSLEGLEVLKGQWKDRFGRWPEETEMLLKFHHLRLTGLGLGFESLEAKEDKLVLKRRGDFVMVGSRFPRLTASKAKNRLIEIEKWLKTLSEK
jgi:transcription-repair coupling factor (superfamily II helicase)